MLPTVRILDPSDNMKKYKFEGDVKSLTFEDVKTFVEGFKSGALSAFLKS